MTFCAWPGNVLRIETITQLWNAPATGQVVVDDLRQRHTHGRQEDPLGRLPEPRVLGGRLADDDRRIDRVAPHRHRRDAEDRERLGVRVVAGVVAERALDPDVVLRDVPLEDDLRVRGHLEIDRLAACTSSTGSPRRNPASMSSSRCFGSGALAEYAVTGSSPIATATGIRPSSAASRSARPSLCICQCMKVEARSITCIRYMPTLRAPDLRVLRDHRRERDERRGVARPAALDRKPTEVDVRRPRRTTSWHGALRDGLRARVGDRLQLEQAPDLLAKPLAAAACRGCRRAWPRRRRASRRRTPCTCASRCRTD